MVSSSCSVVVVGGGISDGGAGAGGAHKGGGGQGEALEGGVEGFLSWAAICGGFEEVRDVEARAAEVAKDQVVVRVVARLLGGGGC